MRYLLTGIFPSVRIRMLRVRDRVRARTNVYPCAFLFVETTRKVAINPSLCTHSCGNREVSERSKRNNY